MWRTGKQLAMPGEALDSLQNWDRKGIALLTGRGGIFQLALVWQVQLRLLGLRVHNVDCAMCFDVFPLCEEARRWMVAPEEILHSITVQRAFTPYQILDVMHRILRHRSSEPTVYCFLAPCKQFFDGDVSQDEAHYLLGLMPELYQAISRKAGPLLIVEFNSYQHVAFAPAFESIRKLAGHIWSLEVNEQNNLDAPASGASHYGQNIDTLFHADRDGAHSSTEFS